MRPIYLRTARERKRWTQKRLEAESGVAQAVISRLETMPNAKAEFDTARNLAAALGIDLHRLRFGPDPRRVARDAAGI